jgi:hypothetical protein
MGQIIGTVNVQVNKQQTSAVRSISYGTRTLKSATDLFIDGAQTGDVMLYDANNKVFTVGSVTNVISEIDGGDF